jgi:hypothetical protein
VVIRRPNQELTPTTLITRIATRTNLNAREMHDYDPLVSGHKAVRYAAKFMLQTELEGQFRDVPVEPEPEPEVTEPPGVISPLALEDSPYGHSLLRIWCITTLFRSELTLLGGEARGLMGELGLPRRSSKLLSRTHRP